MSLLVHEFKTIFESLPGLYLILAPDTTIMAVSDAYQQASLKERKDMIGKNLFEVFPDNPADVNADGVSNLKASLNYVITNRKPHEMAVQKYDIQNADGVFEEKFWAPKNTPVFNDKNELYYIVHQVEDITGRHKAHKQLEEMNFQVSQSNEAIFTLDKERKIRTWNKGAEKLYGFNSKEAIGKDSNELLNTVFTTEEITSVLATLKEKGYWSGELQRKTRAGQDIFVQSSNTTFRDNKGNITGYVAVSFDITEQKKLRQQVDHLANIVELSPDAIISRDMDGKFISWNKGAEKLFGYGKQEAIGKTPVELGIIRFTEKEVADLENEISKTGTWDAEIKFYARNGNTFFGAVTANAIKNELRQAQSLVFIIKDITPRKRLEEYLKSSNDDLEIKVKERTKEVLESEIKYRYLFENNPLPMCIIDEASFKFLDFNRKAVQFYGYSREEFYSMTVLDILLDDDKKAFLKADLSVETNPEIADRRVWKQLKKNGTVILVEISSQQINFENRNARLILSNDVTEIIKAKEKLVASEKRFRALIENSNDVVSLLDNSFKVIYRSPSAFRITGWTDEEMINSNGTKNIHPQDIDKAKDIVQEVMANPGKPINCLFRNLHKNGHYIWMEGVVINLLHDEYVKTIVFNFRDVTERIEAEEKLAASEKFFRVLIENSNDIITLMDGSFKLSYRSPAATRIMGWTNEDMLGVDATKNIHPEDQLYAAAIVTEVMANPSKTIYCKFRMRHKDGHYLWLDGTFTNLLNDEFVKAIVFNFRDVTERIMAEEQLAASEIRFRSLIENSSEGIVLTDKHFNIVYRSPSAEKIMGQISKEKAFSRAHPDDREIVILKHEEALEHPGVPIQFQGRFLHASNQYIWLEGALTNLLCLEGVNAIVTNYRDITTRKLAEEKLWASEKQFRHTLDYMFEGAQIIDFNWRYIYVNDSAAKFGRTKKEELLENTVMKKYPGIEHTELFKAMECCMNERVAKQVETEFVFPDGATADFELSIQPVPEGIFILSIDITERKRAEEKVIQSEIKYRSLFYKSPLPKWIFNSRTLRFLDINDAAIKHYGYSREEFLAMTIKDIRPEEELAKLEDDLSKISGDLDTSRGIWRHRKKSGQMIIVELTAHSIDYGGIKARMVVANDITDKIKAEERLRKNLLEKQLLAQRMSAILNTLPANIALLNEKGIIIDVNDSWKNFADENGFVGSNYCIGDNYIQISKRSFGHEKEEGEKVAKGIKDVLNGSEKEFVLEYDCHSPEVNRWFRMVVSPLKGKAYAGAVVMHINISELRNMEQERLENRIAEQKKITQAMLQGQEKERNYIGRELHDNINQILAGTKLYLGIAGKKDEAVKELVRYPMALIDNSIEEIRILCHNLVTPVKNIDLESLVRDLLNKLDDAEVAKTSFSYEIPKGILSDELKLNIYRIMQEQVNNIYKYSKAKNVSISLKAFDHIVTITVTDDGKGFDTEKNRSGIGISNMINRVESFNGEITIESSPGNGCTISINIPY